MELRSSGLNRAKIFSKRLKIQFVFLVWVPNMRVQESETILRRSRQHFSDLSNWHRIFNFARLYASARFRQLY
jgi:hypothetical protein